MDAGGCYIARRHKATVEDAVGHFGRDGNGPGRAKRAPGGRRSVDDPISDPDFRTLATFRRELCRFLQFSEFAALTQGLSPQQHRALLAIRGSDGQRMTVGE